MEESELREKTALLRQWLDRAEHAVILTGAGVSTDSGLADFRSRDKGIYNQSNPYGCSTDRILSPEFYNAHPYEFFEFYRTKLLNLAAPPNMVHYAIADMERKGRIAAVLTQNADNLHQRAGSVKVIDFHGNVYDNSCPNCGRKFHPRVVAECDGVPRCQCGGIIRPGIVLFGEIPDMGKIMEAVKQLRLSDLLIVAGSSLQVSSSYKLLKSYKGKMAILNLDPTPFDGRADLVINAGLADIFRLLWPMDGEEAGKLTPET